MNKLQQKILKYSRFLYTFNQIYRNILHNNTIILINKDKLIQPRSQTFTGPDEKHRVHVNFNTMEFII